MGMKEAMADGVRYEKTANHGTIYFPTCHICARETFSKNYIQGNKYTCPICKFRKASRVGSSKGMARMRKI